MRGSHGAAVCEKRTQGMQAMQLLGEPALPIEATHPHCAAPACRCAVMLMDLLAWVLVTGSTAGTPGIVVLIPNSELNLSGTCGPCCEQAGTHRLSHRATVPARDPARMRSPRTARVDRHLMPACSPGPAWPMPSTWAGPPGCLHATCLSVQCAQWVSESECR